MSYKSISQSVILQQSQAAKAIADLEHYDQLLEELPVLEIRLDLLEKVIASDKKIMMEQENVINELKEALKLQEAADRIHEEQKAALRKESKTLRRKLKASKLTGVMVITGLAVLMVVQQIN